MGFDTSIFRTQQVQPIQPMNALMQGLQLQGAAQGNALQQLQMQDGHAQRQLAIQQAQEAAAKRQKLNALMQGLQSGQKLDPTAALAAGLSREDIGFLANAGTLGMPKVARTLERGGANNMPETVQLDDFGRIVGSAMPKAVENTMTDIGGQVVPVNRFTQTAPLTKTQTPESIASNATAIRGQNMTDGRARDFNAVQVEANNIKRGEAQQTKDLTKNSQVASFDTMLGTLDRLAKHPGLRNSVGIVGALPTMPGSDSANFQAELNTFQSQAFLPMVAQLKGMGALSDAEGKKLTAAVGALDPRMGEKAFRESVGRITTEMEAARERVSGIPKAATAGPAVGAVEGGYRFKGGDPSKAASWEKQ